MSQQHPILNQPHQETQVCQSASTSALLGQARLCNGSQASHRLGQETRPDSRPETRQETRLDTRPETRQESRTDTRPETWPETRPDTKSETRPQIRPDKRLETRPD